MTEAPTPSDVPPPPAREPPTGVFGRKALLGGLALALRTALLQLVVLGGTVLLARRLSPGDFGVFAIVQFALSFFTMFGDAGLGGALIQKKEAPSQAELSSVFWAQLLVALGVVALVWPLSGLMHLVWRDLPPSSPWILRALAVAFLMTSLRVVPSILMERDMQFVKIALLDVVGSVTFYLTASAGALLGAGIWSLALGVLVQGVVGLLTAHALRPFWPSMTLDRALLRPLLRFGLPFQMKYVVAMIHGAIVPLYGGAALGASAVGLINWAQNTAHFSLRAVDIVSRVSFPLYSKLQNDREELGRAFEKNLRLSAFVAALVSGVLLGIGPQLTSVVYSDKWLPAMPLLRVHALAITIGFISPLVAPLLDALGRPQIVLRMTIAIAVGTWILLPITTHLGGPLGFVLGYVSFMVVGNIYMLWLLSREFPGAKIVGQLLGPAVGLGAVWLAGDRLLGAWVSGPLSLAAVLLACVAVFAAAATIVDPSPARDLLALTRKKKVSAPA